MAAGRHSADSITSATVLSTNQFTMSTNSETSSAVPDCSNAAHVPFPLYDDVLAVVLQYLQSGDLHIAVQLSRQWRQLLKTMKPMSLTPRLSRKCGIRYRSAIARHTVEVINLDKYALPHQQLLFAQLYLLLPNLKFLKIDALDETHFRKQPPASILLPPRLEIFSAWVKLQNCQPILQAVGNLSLLQELHLGITQNAGTSWHQLDFSPFSRNSFLQLTKFHLQHATMSSEYDSPQKFLPAELCTFLRNAATLEYISITCDTEFGPRMLEELVEEEEASGTVPPLIRSGNLRYIEMATFVLDRPTLQLLKKFPSLTTLKTISVELEASSIALLSHLPHLTELYMHSSMGCEFPVTTTSALMAAKVCPQLRKLHFRPGTLRTKELEVILSHLPQLTDLGLHCCDLLDSLKPLLLYNLPKRLKKLSLYRCCHVPISDITECLFPLQELEHLLLMYCFASDIPRDLEDQLQAGSPHCRFGKSKKPYHYGYIARGIEYD